MECVRLKWKGKKCAVAHVNRGCLIQGAEDLKIENAKVIILVVWKKVAVTSF